MKRFEIIGVTNCRFAYLPVERESLLLLLILRLWSNIFVEALETRPGINRQAGFEYLQAERTQNAYDEVISSIQSATTGLLDFASLRLKIDASHAKGAAAMAFNATQVIQSSFLHFCLCFISTFPKSLRGYITTYSVHALEQAVFQPLFANDT